MKKLTKEEFIEKSKKVHGDKYDYSKVVYKNNKTDIIITCPEHDDFPQTPHNHLLGRGCRKCAIERITHNKEKFIEKANKKYNNKFDYSLVEYVNSSTYIKIICPTHGEFTQTPEDHLAKKAITGCRECGMERTGRKNASNTEKFIEKANIVHENKYDYSKVDYIRNTKNVIITCPDHGDFPQTPKDHLRGNGCPTCKSSNGERIIYNFLKSKNILFEKEKSFDGCKDKRNLYFDFYLPEQNICIEFDGQQHFEPVESFGGLNTFLNLKKHDEIKNSFCKNNNIKIFRIKYDKNIKKELSSILC